MYTLHQAYYHLSRLLVPLYDEREASAIVHELLGHITGLDRSLRLIHKDRLFTSEQNEAFFMACNALLAGTPLQYVTHSAWFMGWEFYVDERVLIPRPETEEMVDRIVKEMNGYSRPLTILDVGTGSGCIAVSLANLCSGSRVIAIDKSPEAVEVALRNAGDLPITFHQLDFLDEKSWAVLPVFDLVVSNPPYIPRHKSGSMHTNVKDHEPPMALFVPDDDPLIFYRAIALFGKTHLTPEGAIYCELEQSLSEQCCNLFLQMGYDKVGIHKDMHGNNRIIRIGV